MIRISDIIQEIVVGQPFLEDALQHGYLNLTGFSEYIRPYVEKIAGKSISSHAIKMTLSRLDYPKNLFPYNIRCEHNQINTISGLNLMSIIKNPNTQEMIGKLNYLKNNEINRYMAIIEGSREIDIFYDYTFGSKIEEIIPAHLGILTIKGLSLCSLQLRDEEIYQKGLFYSVTKKLAFHDINIIQVISTYHELGIVIRDEDLKKVVTVLLS
ncbi:MAG: hypothetical protein PHS92_00845 [Candidatus Gracilibacteria bacterium]|nr:hypothetical protein [Candidatus Gracilibacteria bacterium]